MSGERIDHLIVQKKLAKSRSQAQQLIKSGHVEVDGEIVKKSSQIVPISCEIKILKEQQFVGRGADKLFPVLKKLDLDFSGKTVGDIGASTGGFTQIALELGSIKVYAIDVGTDQLDPNLKENPKVINMEGLNVKYPFESEEKWDFILVDLSFISLKKVLKNIFVHMKDQAQGLILFKPQFETEKKVKNKKGVVKDREVIKQAILETYDWMIQREIKVLGIFPCEVLGKMGNQEYFFYISKDPSHNSIAKEEINI